MTTTIVCMRHGQTVDNKEGIVGGTRNSLLTTAGIDAARERVGVLRAAGFDFSEIYASPLPRAVNTAQIIKGGLGLACEVKTDNRLMERFVGAFPQSGRTIEEVHAHIGEQELAHFAQLSLMEKLEYRFACAPHAETPIEAILRFNSFLESIGNNDELREKTVLVVAHGALLGNYLAWKGEVEFQGIFGGDGIPNLDYFVFEYNCGTVTLKRS